MAKELTEQEVMEVIEKDRQSVEEFSKYVSVLLESTPAHTIVIFDKKHPELGENEGDVINPMQVFSGSEEENENAFLYLLWNLYCEHKQDPDGKIDAVLPELERINEMAKAWRKEHKSSDDLSEETLNKMDGFKEAFETPSMEDSRGCIPTEKFNAYFNDLCDKYGFRGFAIYGMLNDKNQACAGYASSDPLYDGSLQFTQLFAAMCENRALGRCLNRAFKRLYELMEHYK